MNIDGVVFVVSSKFMEIKCRDCDRILDLTVVFKSDLGETGGRTTSLGG